MRYLVLLASFMVLALLELPAQAAPPVDLVDQVAGGQDAACQPALPAPDAGELFLTGDVSQAGQCSERADVATPVAFRDPGVLRLLCFSPLTSSTNCSSPLVRLNISPKAERYLGDRPRPLDC